MHGLHGLNTDSADQPPRPVAHHFSSLAFLLVIVIHRFLLASHHPSYWGSTHQAQRTWTTLSAAMHPVRLAWPVHGSCGLNMDSADFAGLRFIIIIGGWVFFCFLVLRAHCWCRPVRWSTPRPVAPRFSSSAFLLVIVIHHFLLASHHPSLYRLVTGLVCFFLFQTDVRDSIGLSQSSSLPSSSSSITTFTHSNVRSLGEPHPPAKSPGKTKGTATAVGEF